MKIFGIDISVWQKGMNLVTAKNEGVQFAIIRGGYTSSDKTNNRDSQFENNYNNAKNSGLAVGLYYFSRAISYAEGKKEAMFLYNNCLKGRLFEYPIYLDVEDSMYQQNAGKSAITEAIKGFCETLEGLGYYVGVYCNLNWANNYMNYNELKDKYDFWIAAWNNTQPNTSNYRYGMWQFGGETNKIRTNIVAGMVCDQNYAFKDYPALMKQRGFNGFPKPQPPVVEPPKEPEVPVVPEEPEVPIIPEPPIEPEIPVIPEEPSIPGDTNSDDIQIEEIKGILQRIVEGIINFFISIFKKKN